MTPCSTAVIWVCPPPSDWHVKSTNVWTGPPGGKVVVVVDVVVVVVGAAVVVVLVVVVVDVEVVVVVGAAVVEVVGAAVVVVPPPPPPPVGVVQAAKISDSAPAAANAETLEVLMCNRLTSPLLSPRAPTRGPSRLNRAGPLRPVTNVTHRLNVVRIQRGSDSARFGFSAVRIQRGSDSARFGFRVVRAPSRLRRRPLRTASIGHAQARPSW